MLKVYDVEIDQPENNLPKISTNKHQNLKQMQAYINIYREEFMRKLQQRETTEMNKRIGIVTKEMKHRKRQKRAWKTIKSTERPQIKVWHPSRSNGTMPKAMVETLPFQISHVNQVTD